MVVKISETIYSVQNFIMKYQLKFKEVQMNIFKSMEEIKFKSLFCQSNNFIPLKKKPSFMTFSHLNPLLLRPLLLAWGEVKCDNIWTRYDYNLQTFREREKPGFFSLILSSRNWCKKSIPNHFILLIRCKFYINNNNKKLLHYISLPKFT